MTEKLAELFEEHARRPNSRARRGGDGWRDRRLAAAAGSIAGLVLAALLIAARFLCAGRAPRHQPGAHAPSPIEATPIASFDNRDPTRVRFGALEFRGGLALTSSYEAFGGISALHVEPDGSHFLALTDNGSWLRGRIVYECGKPAGIADAEMAPMLGPMASRSPRAAGSTPNCSRKTTARSMSASSAWKRSCASTTPKTASRARRADQGAGRLQDLHIQQEPGMPGDAAAGLAARRHPDRGHRAQPRCARQSPLLSLDGDHVARFSVKRSDDFDVSDCTILPPGGSAAARAQLFAGARRRHAHPPHSARRHQAGRAGRRQAADRGRSRLPDRQHGRHRRAPQRRRRNHLTLVSDDNFSVLQRNLLLQFALVGE